jgi:hypothetical protein
VVFVVSSSCCVVCVYRKQIILCEYCMRLSVDVIRKMKDGKQTEKRGVGIYLFCGMKPSRDFLFFAMTCINKEVFL